MNEKGIGLVMLTITIIVLLIIGAFALSMVVGETPETVQNQNVVKNMTNTTQVNNT